MTICAVFMHIISVQCGHITAIYSVMHIKIDFSKTWHVANEK